MLEAGLSAAALAKLAGISPTSLRDALRGESYLGAEKEARIQETASRVAKYKTALQPLDLPRSWMDLEKLMKARTAEEVAGLVGQMFQRDSVANT